MHMKYFIFILLLTFSAGAMAAPVTLPASWYKMPEDQTSALELDSAEDEAVQVAALEKQLDSIFAAQTNALEQSTPAGSDFSLMCDGDRVPWRMVSFMSDLG